MIYVVYPAQFFLQIQFIMNLNVIESCFLVYYLSLASKIKQID